MQKKDIFKHAEAFDKWKSELTPKYIEGGLTKQNSKMFVDYLLSLSKDNSKGHIQRNRTKLRSIFKGLQEKGISDISKANIKDIDLYFEEWKEKGHSVDYVKRWNAFWEWWSNYNRKEGIVVQNLKIKVKGLKRKGDEESSFVWLTKEEFDKFRKYFEEDEQTILLFCFDSLIRFPTECSSLKVENIFEKKGEVWVDIPKAISKTIGRKFNLVYSGEAILRYIEKYKLKPEDYLFNFSSVMFNQKMQRIAKQIWGEKKSEGGEFFKNITGYDLRHSGAIHFRQLFQKTGQSLDLLRERGGWSDFKMINYYTKRLGLDGHIQKEKLLLEEDKSQMEKEIDKLKEREEKTKKEITEIKEYVKGLMKQELLKLGVNKNPDEIKIVKLK